MMSRFLDAIDEKTTRLANELEDPNLAVALDQHCRDVAREAAHRLWWQLVTVPGKDEDGNDEFQEPEVCAACGARREEGTKGPYAPSHRDGLMSECPMLMLDRRIDDAEQAMA